MMSIDPADEDDSADEQRSMGAATPGRKSPAHEGDGGDAEHAVMVDGVQPVDKPAGDAVDGMVSGEGRVPVYGRGCFFNNIASPACLKPLFVNMTFQSVCLVIAGSPEAWLSGRISIVSPMKTRMRNESHELSVVLALAAIARKRRGKQ